jgi:pimeloyl-ACP methyl ester carboxylesterase
MANNSNHSRAQVLSSQLRPADLARIQNPVLIVHGSDDPIFPVEHAYWAAAHIPYAGLLILEKMGHALDTAFFTPINEALTGFWRQQG